MERNIFSPLISHKQKKYYDDVTSLRIRTAPQHPYICTNGFFSRMAFPAFRDVIIVRINSQMPAVNSNQTSFAEGGVRRISKENGRPSHSLQRPNYAMLMGKWIE
jgi:hypothetical protein